MHFKPYFVFIYATVTILPLILSVFIKNKYKKLSSQIQTEENYYYDCIFLTLKNFKCGKHLDRRKECSEYCSYVYYKKFEAFFLSAKKSISLCMYCCTLENIAKLLLKAHREGKHVRVITDCLMSKTTAAKLNVLKDHGIEIKYSKDSTSMFHHKYCLVDEKDKDLGKLFFGSLNLTKQGLLSNFESVIFTNNQKFIKEFSDEYEELWDTI